MVYLLNKPQYPSVKDRTFKYYESKTYLFFLMTDLENIPVGRPKSTRFRIKFSNLLSFVTSDLLFRVHAYMRTHMYACTRNDKSEVNFFEVRP